MIDATLAEAALAGLKVALYRRDGDGVFVPCGPMPNFVPLAIGEGPLPGECDFLEQFVAEVEEAWAADKRGAIKSGLWQESAGGITLYLEATAFRDGDERLIAVQWQDEAWREQFRLQSRSHDISLRREQLEMDVQRREMLIDCVVHDLNNPLSTIILNLQHLARQLDDERLVASVETALGQAQRQRVLVRSLTDLFSAELRAATGHVPDPDQLPDPGEVVRGIVGASAAAAGLKSIAIEVEDLRREAGTVLADRAQLERVVENLLANALRHTPEGGRIALRLADLDREGDTGDVELQIEDSGPGVPEAEVEKLFEPFTQSPNGKRGLSGLGLYYCRLTLGHWGGTIDYRPGDAGGARFVVALRGHREPKDEAK